MINAMKPMAFDEIRQAELEILKDIAKFCDENNLKYFLEKAGVSGS